MSKEQIKDLLKFVKAFGDEIYILVSVAENFSF